MFYPSANDFKLEFSILPSLIVCHVNMLLKIKQDSLTLIQINMYL